MERKADDTLSAPEGSAAEKMFLPAGFVERYRSWFDSFTESYIAGCTGLNDREVFLIKVAHSYRVLEKVSRISTALKIDETARNLVCISALLHDVGRFPQYMHFKTFEDRRSLDHALLGVKILRERGALLDLPPEHGRLILGAIWLHNKFTISPGLAPKLDLISRIIRDADRLDIFHFLVSRLGSGPSGKSLITLPLEPHPTAYSKSIADAVRLRKLARWEDMRWINDFKLLVSSWIYDFSFSITRRMLKESGDLDKLLALLPEVPEIISIRMQLRNDVESST